MNSNAITPEIESRINRFTEKLNDMDWNRLSCLTITAIKQLLPVWNQEVKAKYIVYADHVYGMRHKIAKKTINDYIEYIETHSQDWGTEKTRHPDILELWVALTDGDFTLSRRASHILLATYCLMSNMAKKEDKNEFIEALAHLSQVFENWYQYEEFMNAIIED